MSVVWKSCWRILKFSLLFLIGAFLLVLVAVTFFDQPVPQRMLRRIADSVSNGDWLVSAESASFRLSHGLRIRNVRMFDRRKSAADPVISASQVDVQINFWRLPWRRETILKHVIVTNLKYLRLGDGYYIPDSIEFPGQPDFKEKNEPVALDLPTIHPFSLTLIQPNILDVTPKFVEIPHVEFTKKTMAARGLHLQWIDSEALMTLDGECSLDLDAQRVRGEVHGLARQSNILPLLKALEITNSYAFIESFTKVEQPVDARCDFKVNLRNNDLRILLDLHPTGGRYNNVPLRNVDGKVDVNVFVRDTFQNAHIVVGPIDANLADGTAMSGTILYDNTNDIGYVTFKDIRSTTSLSNALAVADVLNDGTLDCLSISSSPTITIDGLLAVDPAHAATNRLDGTLAFDKGSFFSIPLSKASVAFHVRGTDVTFTNARATAPHGGTVTGQGRISIPEFKQEKASFSVSVKSDGVALTDFADIFKFDVGDKHGTIYGNVTLSGPLQTNLSSRVSGQGHIECRNGHLAQMKVFAGLTDYLAKHVPGIASFVNQSRGSMDFSITNGIFRTDNIHIDGGFFSIISSGTYNIPKDKLDFSARVTFTKNDGFFATLATPITWPFANLSKMLFDFKIFGSLDKPEWKYNKNLMDRLK